MLPWGFVSEDGVEDGEELSCCGDEGDHFGFSCSNEALMEGFEKRIAAFGGEGSHEEDGADGRAPAAGEALAFPFAGLPGLGRQPGKACNLTPIDRTQLGHLGD